MKLQEKFDSCSPEMLPELTEAKMPRASKRRIEKLIRAKIENKRRPKISGRHICSTLTAAAAVIGITVGVRVAMIPNGDKILSETAGTAVSPNETYIDQISEYPSGSATDGKTTVSVEKLFGDGENYFLYFKVKCPPTQNMFIIHSGMELLYSGTTQVWSQDFKSYGDISKAAELQILAGNVLATADPGMTEFEFLIEVDQSRLTGGKYTLKIDSLYSVALEYDNSDNADISFDKFCDGIELNFSIDLPENDIYRLVYENDGSTVRLENDELGNIDLRIDKLTITPLQLYMQLSAWFDDETGLMNVERYFFSNDIDDRYSFFIEYKDSNGELCIDQYSSQERLTMTEKNAVPLQVVFKFDGTIEPKDVTRIGVIPDKDIPNGNKIDPDSEAVTIIWQHK